MVEDNDALPVHRDESGIHAERVPCEIEKPAQSRQVDQLVKGVHQDCRFAACLKMPRSPCEGTRPAGFPMKSPCIVGPVTSPGGFFNRLLAQAECSNDR